MLYLGCVGNDVEGAARWRDHVLQDGRIGGSRYTTKQANHYLRGWADGLGWLHKLLEVLADNLI